MANEGRPRIVRALDVPGRTGTNYPPEFAPRVAGRVKRPLGDWFGIESFGVNLTTLAPGSQSALRHCHHVQDEFVFVLEGELTLVDDDGERPLAPGMCAGFRHGESGHHLINRSSEPATYLEIGDRLPGDGAEYPDDDLVAERAGAGWRFTRKDGSPY